MKKTLFFSLIVALMTTNAFALSLAPVTSKKVKALDFDRYVTLRYSNDAYDILRKCSPIQADYCHEAVKPGVIGDIKLCAINMIPWRTSQIYFYQKDSKTYLRQVKTLGSFSYEVKTIYGNEVLLGELTESH